MNTDNYVYAPKDVALIINLIIGSHGGYLETPNVVGVDIAFKIMFYVFGGDNYEARDLIEEVAKCDTVTANDATLAVRAYMGKTQ